MTEQTFHQFAAHAIESESLCPDRFPTEFMPHHAQVGERVYALYADKFGPDRRIYQVIMAVAEAYVD